MNHRLFHIFMFKTSIDLEVRLKFFKLYIWSIALYGCERWTVRILLKQKKKGLKVFVVIKWRNLKHDCKKS